MGLRDDLRTAFQSLSRRPGFVAVVVLNLGVALGANTAVFGFTAVATLVPAGRAARLDPVKVLRGE